MENHNFTIISSYLLSILVQVPIKYKSPSKNTNKPKHTNEQIPTQNIEIPSLSLSQIVQPSNSHGADLQFYSLGGGGKKTMSLKPKWVTLKILSK